MYLLRPVQYSSCLQLGVRCHVRFITYLLRACRVSFPYHTVVDDSLKLYLFIQNTREKQKVGQQTGPSPHTPVSSFFQKLTSAPDLPSRAKSAPRAAGWGIMGTQPSMAWVPWVSVGRRAATAPPHTGWPTLPKLRTAWVKYPHKVCDESQLK